MHNVASQSQLTHYTCSTPIIPSHFPPHFPPHCFHPRHAKMSTYPCYIPPQTPACTFDALTSSPGIFYETLMHPATRSGSPHNALHSPSIAIYIREIQPLNSLVWCSLTLAPIMNFIKLPKCGPAKTGPAGPAPTPMSEFAYLNTFCMHH